MGFFKGVFLVAFIAWLCTRIFVINKNLRILGFGIPVFSHAPGPCKVFYVNGSEDIDVLPNGLAIISSGLRLNGSGLHPTLMDREGKLYAFDFNNPDRGLKELLLESFDKSEFNPHGIDMYTDPATEETSLFVVNHPGGKETVEIFQFDQGNLVLNHKRTVADKNIYFPNDVVAVGPDSFYVTNYRYFASELLMLVEFFYPIKLGNVVFYNGTQGKIVAKELHMANGINIDKTGQYIFVAAALEGTIHVYKRKDDNTLEQQQEIYVGKEVDNIFVDEINDDLWTGSTTIQLMECTKNVSNPCPAKALQVKLSRGSNDQFPFNVNDIVEVYSSRGNGDIKGSSSAVVYNGKMLVGTVFSNLLYCDIVAV